MIVGLGNPGERFEGTRHNAGFLLVDRLMERFGPGKVEHHEHYFLFSATWREKRLYLMKPMTFMNLSGRAVMSFLRRRDIEPRRLLVAFDDVALPLGSIRIRPRGSSGGQKGMRHMIETLGTAEIPRLRIGIRPRNDPAEVAGNPHESLTELVLGGFSEEERPIIGGALEHAADAACMWLTEDFATVMSGFNTRGDPDPSIDRGPNESNIGGES